MAREGLSDFQVEKEIERLKDSEFVKLARKEERVRYQRRQILYQLRWLENKGKALAEAEVSRMRDIEIIIISFSIATLVNILFRIVL